MEHNTAVMAMPLDPEQPNFAKVLAAKQAVASSMLTATARINAGLLRPQSDDGFEKVRQAMERARRGEDALAEEPEPDIFS